MAIENTLNFQLGTDVPDLMAEVHVQCGRTVVDLGAQPPLPVRDGKLGADRADEALIYSK